MFGKHWNAKIRVQYTEDWREPESNSPVELFRDKNEKEKHLITLNSFFQSRSLVAVVNK